MSRISKKPVELPKGVEFKSEDGQLTVKGAKGTLSLALPENVTIEREGDVITLNPVTPADVALTGTIRTLLANMVTGVTEGFERKLQLVGVGYRAAMQGNDLNLSLGFSHPVVYVAPEGITLEAPTQTEILVKGSDKQKVGQVAAEIRAFRPPEPYKGKGVRYAGEHVIIKEAKKA